MSFPCINCNNDVGDDDAAVRCDTCNNWCHIDCSNDITHEEYNQLIDGIIDLVWHCTRCRVASEDIIRANDLPAIQQIGDILEPECSALINNEPRTDEPRCFSILIGASNKGGDILIDPQEYCYRKKIDSRRSYVDWVCRNARKYRCKAGFRELGNGRYTPLPVTKEMHQHICIKDNFAREAEIRRDLKKQAVEQVHISANRIIENALVKKPQLVYNIPKRATHIRILNKHRQDDRPSNPSDLSFVLLRDKLPQSFIVRDITIGTSRHIILITIAMATMLGNAKTWYLDGTFRIISRPFIQLFGIHAFATHGNCTKQVPLVFVMMSSRKREDYVAVYNSIKQLLPRVSTICNILS